MPSRALLLVAVGVAAAATLLFYPDPNGYSLAYDLGILGTNTDGGKYIDYHLQTAALPAAAVAIIGTAAVLFLTR